MRAVSNACHYLAWVSLCLPLLQAKDFYPFLDESLLRLEDDESNEYEKEAIRSRNRPSFVSSIEDQSGEGSGGWSEWGPWMTCSRSCDGGIAISLRKCRGRCPHGEPIRRQICNMQPCSEPTDFRAAQCSAYNNRPYRGRLYKWLPFHDPEDPCVLACQAEGVGFVAKHSKKVHDGTRCREGALDMCVEGRCQPIGCDLQVGSTLKVDECGVCGGDGSQCHKPTFVWNEGTFGPCSVTCGGGISLSEATCRNKETNEEVDPRLCNLSIRPRTKAMHCNREPCPVVWETGDWGPCSATCGPGMQSRPAFCVQGGPNGSRIDVKTQFCPAHKPQTERSCNVEECPRWFQGVWTPCSVTCGQGIQTRAVVCRDTKNQYSENCDLSEMPRPQRPCDTRVLCPTTDEGETPPPQPCVYTPSTDDESDPTTTEEATTEMEPVIMLTEAPKNLTGGVGPMFFVGPWGRCNGEGFRQRAVYCRVFIEMSKTAAGLPDSQCTEVRPVDVEPCAVSCPPIHPPREVVAPVMEVNRIESEDLEPDSVEVFHSWNTEKFSPCSASCGGGVHESLVRCLRLPDQVEVSPQLCDQDIKPEPLTQRCNEQPCPISFRWSVSEYGNCSRECGGGIRSRLVRCLQVENEEESPYSQCPGLPPKAAENCNVFDCPAQWKTEPWSKCSKSCDGGFQTRKLLCEKILAPLSQAVLLPPSKCVKTRPKAVKRCNLKPCPPPPVPRTTSTTSTTTTTTTTAMPEKQPLEEEDTMGGENQVFEQKYPNRRVNLKAAGRATLFKGSNAKFHCPLHVNGSRVLWFKGHLRIPPSTTNGWPRVAVSGKGALRIHKITLADEGTYTCLSGAFRSDVELKVKPLPPRQPDFFVESSTIAAITTTTSSPPSRKVTYRSALPQVRHFLVNLRHFEEDKLQSDPIVLEYDWVVGPWSQCSQTCGQDATQVRTADCRVRVLSNATRIMSRGLCVDGGLPEPLTIRSCNLDPCPEWITSEWSECSSKNCLSWNTAYQKRGVLCTVANRTVTPSHCDSRKRPRRKKECRNALCQGSWKVSQWTKCTATCGNKGFQTRGVHCVWQGTLEPAPTSVCKETMPPTSIACGRVPCIDEDEEDCYDQSTYCGVVKETKLCEISQFRLQCCASCNKKK